jgi:hypothetical protein
MSHSNHVVDGVNKDLLHKTKQDYLDMTKNWVDPYGPPKIEEHDGVMVVRDDSIVGSKARFGDLLMQTVKEDTIVYVQPRFGLAGLSILEAAKRHGKKVVLFMPASKEVSHHQACCIAEGAYYSFVRIAAMPNLNKVAKEWADKYGGFFVPLGLKHELVTACAVRVADDIKKQIGNPTRVWCATSTGVLTRALQIGFDESPHTIVAVSRNLKDGESGIADIISDPLEFTAVEKRHNLPPFPTVSNYDGKVWKYIPKDIPGQLMWNVGREPMLTNYTALKVRSNVPWGAAIQQPIDLKGNHI